jgi:hypothetical protein
MAVEKSEKKEEPEKQKKATDLDVGTTKGSEAVRGAVVSSRTQGRRVGDPPSLLQRRARSSPPSPAPSSRLLSLLRNPSGAKTALLSLNQTSGSFPKGEIDWAILAREHGGGMAQAREKGGVGERQRGSAPA